MLGFPAIKTEVLARLGNRTDINARVERWINYAYFELLANPRFYFYEIEDLAFFNTIANVGTYPLFNISNGTLVWVILGVYDETNRQSLRKSHMIEFERRGQTYMGSYYSPTPVVSKPTDYTRFSNAVILYPIPDGDYQITMRYRRRPSEASSTDTSFLGLKTEWEELLIALSTLKGFEYLGQTDRAKELREMVEYLMSIREEAFKLDDANLETGIQPDLDGH